MPDSSTALIVVAIAILAIWHGMAGYVVWLHKRLVRSRNAAIAALDELEPLLSRRRSQARGADVPGVTSDTDAHLAARPYNDRIAVENELTRTLQRWRTDGDAHRQTYAAAMAELDAQIASRTADLNAKAGEFHRRMASPATKVITWVMELEPYARLDPPPPH